MVCVIATLSDAGKARSDLGSAFLGVEHLRIDRGERLTLLIWWDRGDLVGPRKIMSGFVQAGLEIRSGGSRWRLGSLLIGRISVAVGGSG
jgi:hypothetical protein